MLFQVWTKCTVTAPGFAPMEMERAKVRLREIDCAVGTGMAAYVYILNFEATGTVRIS